MRLSNVIYRKAKKYKLNPKLVSAIFAQESGYKLEAKNCVTGYNSKNEIDTVCSDFGIGQIHFNTAKKYNFDTKKLTKDLEYSVEAGTKVLSYFKKRYKNKEKLNWWSRYNSSSPIKRRIYEKLVKRYF